VGQLGRHGIHSKNSNRWWSAACKDRQLVSQDRVL
jgi:hypothetical protein